jgi:hypothetical protein
MVVLLLCEPRSGSTNLANWFYYNKNFTTFFNPDTPTEYRNSTIPNWYQNDISPKDYKYETEHLLIKEDFYHYKNYSEFVEVSDKVICLYRKNESEQIESWVNAKKTNNWDGQWGYSKDDFKLDETEVIFFKELKKTFKEQYLTNPQHFKISYEELYHENGFQKIVDYLNLDCVENINFPIGEKYRIEINKLKTLI